ncbi:hypothetical protein GO308_13580 [Sphingomonas sp. SFZ2018-12]|nr:hypothetical protein [Sphingomonas sp. SFZ2018-12]
MHDPLQEPYLGKLEHFAKMALVDRHEPEWVDLNSKLLEIALKDQIDEQRVFKKQSLDWLMTANGAGLAFLLSFMAIKSSPPETVVVLLPSFIAYFFGLIGAWITTFYATKESENWVGFYLRHMRYDYSLKLYHHSRIDTTKYWNDANRFCEKIISNNLIYRRGILLSILMFFVGTANLFSYILIYNF